MSNKPLSDSALLNLLHYLDTQDSFVLFETTKVTEDNFHSYLFLNPVDTLVCLAGEPPEAFFEKAEATIQKGYYLAGWFSYELGYLLEPKLHENLQVTPDTPLAILSVYKKPHIYNHRDSTFSGAGPWPTHPSHKVKDFAPYSIADEHLSQRKEDYINNIHRIKSYIESGDTYQVNYTLKHLFNFSGAPASLYKTLRRNQSVSYSAYIKTGPQHIMSFSPELFLRKQGRDGIVRPMKGTIHRGCTPSEDKKLTEFLRHDLKNRSENVMIVDLLRNDLGRLCEMGSVQGVSLFDVETYETLHQMTSTIQGKLRSDITLDDLFRAIFPSGSVTGAPKIRTMEIIHELEREPRGVYTGGIGFFTPEGDIELNVPIRTLVLENDKGEMGIGSGIVYDSDAEKEWEECLLKGHFLTQPKQNFELIETILWQPGKGYWLLTEHLDRLVTSANYFGFQASREAIESNLNEYAGDFNDSSPQRVRLLLQKDGSVACKNTPCEAPAPISLNTLDNSETTESPRITISSKTTNSQSPFLYHKTTQREFYDTEREQAVKNGYFEVIFTNERGEITEGAITNIFIRKNDMLLTPPQECGLLDGVFRRYLMEQPETLTVQEAVLTLNDLENADAIYIGNSVRGLVQVTL